MKARNQKRNQKGAKDQHQPPRLTMAQSEILYMLRDEHLTVQQIASRRGCSDRFIRKVRADLRAMGLLSLVPFRMVPEGGGPHNHRNQKRNQEAPRDSKDKRLHAFKFRIELIRPIPEEYLKRHAKKWLWVDGHFVQCFSECILVQGRKDFGVCGETEEEALAESIPYWFRFFHKLEHEFNLLLVKNRKGNITLTYAEWGTMPSRLSEEARKEGKKIYVYDDNGKLMFHCDVSFLHEHESHGSAAGITYSEDINGFLKDIMQKRPPKASELAHCVMALSLRHHDVVDMMHALTEQNKETAAALFTLLKSLQPGPSRKEPAEPARYIG